jgi:hypothetical protein
MKVQATRATQTWVALSLLAFTSVWHLACQGSESPTGPNSQAIFVIRACASPDRPGGELFRILTRDPAVISEATSLLGKGNRRIAGGRLSAGDGGFNQPWHWHLTPESVAFSDASLELCDGCPSFVENDLGYWLDVVGSYCPWSTEVVARER